MWRNSENCGKRGVVLFRGIYPLNMDSKGRIAIPTKLRPELHERCDGKLMVTADPDRCLMLYTFPDWEKVEKQFDSRPTLNQSVRNLKRLIIGHAMECDMDGQGRISFSEALRQFASLDKQVVLVGQTSKFEIWNEAAWNERCAALCNDISLNALDQLDPAVADLVF